MVVDPGMKSLFWSSLATGTEQHTAQFMAAQLERVIAEIHRETRALVVGVLTDNAPNMASAWELLENKLPVFGGDIFKKILFMKKIKEDALSIVHFVREHHALLDQFRHLQRTQIPPDQARHALVIPVATRWYTAHACLRSVLHNRAILEDLFQSSRHAHLMERYNAPATVRSKLLFVKELIGSDFFWQNLAFAVAMVVPVIEALRELESDGVPTMSRNTRRRVRAEFYGFVNERWKFVHTNAISIAYLLDPNTDPDGFIDSDEADSISQACAFAVRTGMLDRLEITRAQLNRWLYAFADEKRSYTEEDKEKNAGAFPRHWWRSHAKQANAKIGYKALNLLASYVFSIPTSSASSERAWSIFDYIHTKKRNRLSTTKVEMLAFVYINSAAKTNVKLDLARLQLYPEAEEHDIEVNNHEDTLVM
ncbi:hypothetical protein PHYSODRAFT_528166 [Phytophthora sojae]|uniref:HAT C-terminal dimerisation domain-containing protein n=1 Tax=Phytophthora sojae (strain P6497) TaxID=1094619 RepID=G5AA92_PHYSP|nr:hypothetical protein PHYSODRAFT_528166 [Phytophthora sojae]EGZ07521.1 hypothetical protein PHYSODRAFT_528166 [Phytophthora sojae]|eukprot:XP_009537087.1 hypothetical protein PHYSODRAFT_528166 [Phytophthora sojae]